MNTLLILVLAYLAGSIPTGYWVVMGVKKVDLRQIGSGSTGTTNVLRTAGKSAAAFTFFIDIAKGYLPVFFSVYAVQNGWTPELNSTGFGPWLPFVVALLCLVGHSKSVFLNFQGGKSAATGLGTMMAMNLPAALCTFAVFVTVTWTTKYVSLASMTAVICSAVLMYLFVPTAIPYITFCICGAFYVCLRHKDNIKRLMAGTERKIGQKAEIPPGNTPSTQNHS